MKIQIFDYMDAHLYLQDYYKLRKEADSRFSYARWAAELGFNNKTLLRLILQGKRQISPKSREQFKKCLQLNEKETTYFETLIDYTQATSASQRQAAGKRLIQLQRQNLVQIPIDSGSGVLEDVFGPILLTTISSATVPMTATELASIFSIEISRVEAILKTFERLGLIEKKEAGYTGPQQPFKISDQFGSQALRNFYSYWLQQSVTAMNLPFEVRRYRSLQIALTAEEFEEVVEVVNEFALSLLSKVEKNTLNSRRLYLLNTALFPVTEII